jgi:hypothetical protein
MGLDRQCTTAFKFREDSAGIYTTSCSRLKKFEIKIPGH